MLRRAFALGQICKIKRFKLKILSNADSWQTPRMYFAPNVCLVLRGKPWESRQGSPCCQLRVKREELGLSEGEGPAEGCGQEPGPKGCRVTLRAGHTKSERLLSCARLPSFS